MYNNPMLIKQSSIRWKGMMRRQSDPDYVDFKHPAYSYCAAFLMMYQLRKQYGCNTVRKLVDVWPAFPLSEKELVLQRLTRCRGIELDKLVAGKDANAFMDIMQALSRIINSKPARRREVSMGLWYAMRYHEKVTIPDLGDVTAGG